MFRVEGKITSETDADIEVITYHSFKARLLTGLVSGNIRYNERL